MLGHLLWPVSFRWNPESTVGQSPHLSILCGNGWHFYISMGCLRTIIRIYWHTLLSAHYLGASWLRMLGPYRLQVARSIPHQHRLLPWQWYFHGCHLAAGAESSFGKDQRRAALAHHQAETQFHQWPKCNYLQYSPYWEFPWVSHTMPCECVDWLLKNRVEADTNWERILAMDLD